MCVLHEHVIAGKYEEQKVNKSSDPFDLNKCSTLAKSQPSKCVFYKSLLLHRRRTIKEYRASHN